MKKEIKNFYSIRTLHRKRTWSYEYEYALIVPEDEFNVYSKYYYSYKSGDLNVSVTRNELSSFNIMDSVLYKSCRIDKRKAHKEIILLVTSGLICTNCHDYFNDYEHNNASIKMDSEILEQGRELTSRDQLAKYIRLVRKTGVRYKKFICWHCDAELKRRAKEEKEQKRLRLLDEQIENDLKAIIEQSEHKKTNSSKSYLYLMKCNRTGYYKIGRSKNPAHRERTLQAETPTIQMVASFKDKDFYEKAWHIHFEKERLRGEWFNLTRAQVAYFCHLMRKSDDEIDAVLMQEA